MRTPTTQEVGPSLAVAVILAVGELLIHASVQARTVAPRRVIVNARLRIRIARWVVLAQAVRQGIPPGMGYVVDKFSRRAFARRYIDVGGKLEVFTTP